MSELKFKKYFELLNDKDPAKIDSVITKMKKDNVFIITCFDDTWCYIEGCLTAEYCLYDVDKIAIMPDGTLYNPDMFYPAYYLMAMKHIDIQKQNGTQKNTVDITFTSSEMPYCAFKYAEIKQPDCDDLNFNISGAIFDLTEIKRQFIKEVYDSKCALCGEPLHENFWHAISVQYTSDNGIVTPFQLEDTPNNQVAVCLKCSNVWKQTKDLNKFRMYIEDNKNKYPNFNTFFYFNNNEKNTKLLSTGVIGCCEAPVEENEAFKEENLNIKDNVIKIMKSGKEIIKIIGQKITNKLITYLKKA